MVKILTDTGPRPFVITLEYSEVTNAHRWVAKASNGRVLFYSPWNNSRHLLNKALETMILKIKQDQIKIVNEEDDETTPRV